MSRLTPSRAGTAAELENALDILASRTWTCAQLSKLIRALHVDGDVSAHAPDMDDMADQFYEADMALQRDFDQSERYEMPFMGGTLSALETLGTKGCAV
jgi:hypothetical protein